MIQRIQTIHLLLSVLIGILAFVLDLKAAAGAKLTGDYAGTEAVMWAFVALIGLGVVFAAWSIFLFKNRLRQIRVVGFSTIAFALAVIAIVTLEIINGTNAPWRNLGAVLPAVCVLFNVLATRRIRFDERLVRSADRLR